MRDWRRARADGKPAYTVCRDTCLAEIARRRPRDQVELLAIPGIGPGFVTNHGDDLLAAMRGLAGEAGPTAGAPAPSVAAASHRHAAPRDAAEPAGRG